MNHGNVFAAGDLRQVPAQGAIDPQQVVERGAFVDPVEHEEHPVFKGARRKGLAQAGVHLTDGSGLVRVKKHQNQVGDLSEIADDILVVVAPVALGDAVQHARGIDDGQFLQKRRVYLFQPEMGRKTLAVFFHGFKRKRRVIEEKIAVALLGHMNGAAGIGVVVISQDRERIVGGRLTGFLYVASQKLVDQGRLARGVVAQHQHQGAPLDGGFERNLTVAVTHCHRRQVLFHHLQQFGVQGVDVIFPVKLHALGPFSDCRLSA